MTLVARRIYLDCDGVLADFDTHFRNIFDGIEPGDYEAKVGGKIFWASIQHRDPNFFENLPLMVDAEFLHDFCDPYRPVILTGCPKGGWAEMQKIKWAQKYFPGTPMVTCMARDKRKFCRSGDILIDDRTKHAQKWQDAGGVFVHHKNADESIQVLNAFGY